MADKKRSGGALRWGLGLGIYTVVAVAGVIWLPEILLNQSVTEQTVTDSLTPVDEATAITAARQAVLFGFGVLLAVFTLFLTQRRDALARDRHEIVDVLSSWIRAEAPATVAQGNNRSAATQ